MKNGNREWVREVRKKHPPFSMEEYLHDWELFFDQYAAEIDYWHDRNAGYHKAVTSLVRFCVPAEARVLEVGSGNGDLLAALNPSYGVGIDISSEMVHLAAQKYPHLRFEHMPSERLELPGEKFDYIILSDLLGYLYDIRLVFERLHTVCHSRTRLIVHWYSRLWQPVLGLAEKLGLKYPQPFINWTTVEDVLNLFISSVGHLPVPQ
jgi:ubiquinone/menaquinone biosynthesis C-methylase UbiE